MLTPPTRRVAGVARSQLARALRRRARDGTGLILMYHALAERRAATPQVAPPLSTGAFERQLAHLARHYDVVPLGGLQGHSGARLPVAITFDDDLRSHVELAAPLLARHGMTATFFLTGATLAEPHAFWWQDVDRILHRDGWDTLQRELAISHPWTAAALDFNALALAFESTPIEEMDAIARTLRELAGGAPPGGLEEADVRALHDMGFEIGFHTRRHHALTHLDEAALDHALRDGRDELAAAVGAPVTTIAYPFCRADARVADAARRAGFRIGVTCTGRAVTRRSPPLLLDRLDGQLESLPAFSLRLARAAATG